MLYLDSESQKDIRIYINCSGGEVVPSLALHDTMRYLKSDVGTIGFGACMGMSGFLLATGTKGKRAVLPNTRVMLHHPSGMARGQAADIDNEARGEEGYPRLARFTFFLFALSWLFAAFFSSGRGRGSQRKRARETARKRRKKRPPEKLTTRNEKKKRAN
jgi:hypothetical protein